MSVARTIQRIVLCNEIARVLKRRIDLLAVHEDLSAATRNIAVSIANLRDDWRTR
jgi:hypothetical protein